MKKIYIIIVAISGLIVGFLITWQFRSNIPIEGDFPADEISAKDTLVNDFLDEQAYLQGRIISLRKEMDDSQKKLETESETSNLDILTDLKKIVGLTEAKGAGIEITLEDGPYAEREGADVTDKDLVQASDIRDLVNLLNAANATAVSVNNQRTIYLSPISSVGTTILVNNTHIAPPFKIEAVGDADLMLQRILNESLLPSIYERSSKNNITFTIAKKDFLVIPMYNGDFKTDYLNLVE